MKTKEQRRMEKSAEFLELLRKNAPNFYAEYVKKHPQKGNDIQTSLQEEIKDII